MPRSIPDPDLRRWTGVAAFAVAATLVAEVSIRMTIGPRPELDQSAALVAYMERASGQTIAVVVIDTVLMACLIVFFACFRQLIGRHSPNLQWVADLNYGAGLVFVAVTLVGDALEGGAALDVVGLTPSADSIRAMFVGHALLFGSSGAVLLALVAGSAAYLVLASGALPRPTGVLAGVAAVLNVAAVPMAWGGTDPTAFGSAGGWGNAVFAIFPLLLWVVAVGVVTVRGRAPGLSRAGDPIAD